MGLSANEQAHYSESLQPLMIGLLVALLFISNVSLILRLCFVFRRRGSLYFEDYMVIIGQIFSDGVVGALFAAIKLGLGLHEYRVLAEDPSPPLVLARIEEIIWAYAVMNNVCLFAIKMSILLFYHRLFHVQHWFRTAWWINVVSAILWLVGSTLFYIFQCTPIDFFWTHLGAVTPNPSLYVDPQGYCTSGAAKIGAPILVNNLSDVAVLLLPIPVVFGLKTTWTKRVRLILLFSIGALAAASGFARLATLFTSDGDATCEYPISDAECPCMIYEPFTDSPHRQYSRLFNMEPSGRYTRHLLRQRTFNRRPFRDTRKVGTRLHRHN